MKNISIGALFKPLGRLVGRFQITLFIVLVVAGLGGAVLFLNSILTNTSNADGYISPVGAGSIDQATLERLKELHTSDQGAPAPVLPAGRTNPFGE